MERHKKIHFQHGLGDCIHFARLLQLYRQDGWSFTVTGDKNKEWIWKVAGVEYGGSGGGDGVGWGYPGSFEDPIANDWEANKIAHNINHPPLPNINEPKSVLWERLCGTIIDATPFIRDECRREARNFIDGLPHPIVALHSRGTTWTHRKDIPDVVCFNLIRSMLNRGWSVLILDWDSRAPMVSHKHCRSIIPSWCMIDPERECALFDEIDLLIGIDSGPFHVASFREIPTLGVFREILPWRCSLPNPNAVNLVPNQHGRAMRDRQDWFHFWQYSGELNHVHIIQAAEAMMRSETYDIDHFVDAYEALTGDYLYVRVGHDSRMISLGNEFAITSGGGKAEREWKAYEVGGSQHILLSGEHGLICDLQLCEDGVYRGRWAQFECMPIELVPSLVLTDGESRSVREEDVERYISGAKRPL